KRQRVGDQVVDVDLAFHVPVDNLGHVGAAPGATEGRALPFTARDQLEGARADFGAGLGHADDHGLAPPFVTAFQGLAHDFGIADALERVIGAAVGQLDDVVDDVLDFLGVDEVRHAELARHGFALRVHIHADDLVGANHLGALDHVQADAAQAEYHHVGARLDFGRVHHRAHAGGHAAADVADLVEGRVFAHLGHGDLRHHDVVGEGRCPHVVKQRLAA